MTGKTSVRLMAPFAMRCAHCEGFIYRGTKFNARKMKTGERYLGIAIVAFAIRCPSCGHEIDFRTDPASSGYVINSGASRLVAESNEKIEAPSERLNRLEREKEDEINGGPRDTLGEFERANLRRQREAEKDRELISLRQNLSSNDREPSGWVAVGKETGRRKPKVILPQPKRRKAASAS